jgi:hypothetical protein
MLSHLYVQTAIIFTPMILEFFLKLKGHFKAENYCSRANNGHLEYHGRIESLTHILMKRFKLTEKGLVVQIYIIEAITCGAVISLDLAF